MTMIRNNPPNRAAVVSDRNNPTPSLTTSLPREIHDALGRIALRHNLSKSAYLRKLVLEHVEEQTDGWTCR